MLIAACNRCAPRGQGFRAEAVRVAVGDASRANRIDPTGTLDIRAKFRGELDRRWSVMRRLIVDVIDRNDAMGIGGVNSRQAATLSAVAFLPINAPDKIGAFQRWIDEAMRQVVLGGDGSWTQKYVAEAAARARGRARGLLGLTATDAEWNEEDHPRDEGGKFASGGGGDRPGEGYSDEARVRGGKIYTSDVHDAVRALFQNREVELDQPRQVSTLLKKLGKVAKEMAARGEAAPNFNLCNVSVRGTNLFCADSKGIPRIKMPQIEDGAAFRAHLESRGVRITNSKERASYLRATQSELIGAKVARMVKEMAAGTRKSPPRLFVSRDNYILDGHHRWAAVIGRDAKDNVLGDKRMKIARVDMGIVDLLKAAKKFSGPAKGLADRRTIADAADIVQTMASLCVTELQGVLEAVSQRALRALADGHLANMRASAVAREVALIVTAVGRKRSRDLANTVIVKTFSAVTLDQFRAAGVTRVGTTPERLRVVRGSHGLTKARDAFDPDQPRDPNSGEWSGGSGSAPTAEEMAALHGYGNLEHERINKSMRHVKGTGEESKYAAKIALITAAVEKSPLGDDAIFYRGVGGKTGARIAKPGAAEKMIGHDLPAAGFQSTSRNVAQARRFADHFEPVIMKIKAAKGTPALDMRTYGRGIEKEMLMLPGSYHVDKITRGYKDNKNGIIIHVTYKKESAHV